MFLPHLTQEMFGSFVGKVTLFPQNELKNFINSAELQPRKELAFSAPLFSSKWAQIKDLVTFS